MSHDNGLCCFRTSNTSLNNILKAGIPQLKLDFYLTTYDFYLWYLQLNPVGVGGGGRGGED